MLGRTMDQIRTTEQVNAGLTTCQTLKLDGLVIIGGKFLLKLLSLNKKMFYVNYTHSSYLLSTLRCHIQYWCSSACWDICRGKVFDKGAWCFPSDMFLLMSFSYLIKIIALSDSKQNHCKWCDLLTPQGR